MPGPPDLSTPFASDKERTAAVARLLWSCFELELWQAAATGTLGEAQRQTLRRGLAPGDTPEGKLQRWAALFDEELRAALATRNAVAHGQRVSDPDLRGAEWLALHLLSLLDPDAQTTLASTVG